MTVWLLHLWGTQCQPGTDSRQPTCQYCSLFPVKGTFTHTLLVDSAPRRPLEALCLHMCAYRLGLATSPHPLCKPLKIQVPYTNIHKSLAQLLRQHMLQLTHQLVQLHEHKLLQARPSSFCWCSPGTAPPNNSSGRDRGTTYEQPAWPAPPALPDSPYHKCSTDQCWQQESTQVTATQCALLTAPGLLSSAGAVQELETSTPKGC